MVTGPDGSEKILMAEIDERKMRDDPEKYAVESWSSTIIILIIMGVTTLIGEFLVCTLMSATDPAFIWFILAFIGNLAWASIATVYTKKQMIKRYMLEHPEKYDISHL